MGEWRPMGIRRSHGGGATHGLLGGERWPGSSGSGRAALASLKCGSANHPCRSLAQARWELPLTPARRFHLMSEVEEFFSFVIALRVFSEHRGLETGSTGQGPLLPF